MTIGLILLCHGRWIWYGMSNSPLWLEVFHLFDRCRPRSLCCLLLPWSHCLLVSVIFVGYIFCGFYSRKDLFLEMLWRRLCYQKLPAKLLAIGDSLVGWIVCSHSENDFESVEWFGGDHRIPPVIVVGDHY